MSEYIYIYTHIHIHIHISTRGHVFIPGHISAARMSVELVAVTRVLKALILSVA